MDDEGDRTTGGHSTALRAESARTAPRQTPAYVDTASLWSLDAMLDPEKFYEPRWPQFFAQLCDYSTDPSYDLRCLLPVPDRQHAVVPTFVGALTPTLLTAEVLPKGSLEPSSEELKKQFSEFLLHATHDTGSMRDWFRLHTSAAVSPGWTEPSLPSDAEWKGVYPGTRDWLELTASAELDAAASALEVSRYQAALLFSLLQRGWPYYQHAVETMRGQYIPHMVRWQVARNPATLPPTPVFGLVLGGVVLDLLKIGALQRDAQQIADVLIQVRAARITYEHQAKAATDTKKAQEFLAVILPGVVGGKLNSAIEGGLRIAIASVLELAGLGLQGFNPSLWGAYSVVAPFFAGTAPIVLSPVEARILRKFMDYHGAGLDIEDVCGLCGARRRNRVCVVCRARAQPQQPRGD